ERRRSPGAMIDPGLQKCLYDTLAVQPAMPGEMSCAVVLGRPFLREQRFCLRITLLLLQITAQRAAAVMPHDRRPCETDGPATFLQPPADVDVISGNAKTGIEASDLQELVASIGHVAAGDVLGEAVREQNVNGTARGVRDAVSDDAVAGRRDVGPPDAGMLSVAQA